MRADELALAPEAGEQEDDEAHHHTDWWAEARGILWLVVAVLGFHSLIAKPFYIPSESMLPLLRVGDRLVVTKYPYGYSYVTPTFHLLPFMPGRLMGSLPQRGDVVIVTPPGQDTDYIKRVIALPGDRIAVRGGVVWLNGRPLEREWLPDQLVPVDANTRCSTNSEEGGSQFYAGRRVRAQDGALYCRLTVYRETLPGGPSYVVADLGHSAGDDFPEMRVPRGRVFLMGDNRDNSADSRYPVAVKGLGGPVPWENIGGRAEFITFSLDGTATWNPLTWFSSFRSGRAGMSLRPERGTE
ncbi:signal peptidase I [Sphingomonas canadensis]|uniref:Signal peptidase I n=1 Tax=Sphingomonas canadensis TaxID=1219257 RepID=A0ABW3HE05_9SPHN|nr:signal peptidase I [Sphingomonas canadensis]MCW3837203.1 signal peptidase I [Sphingomonas canadensis]